jgi:hypothetical protein
VLVVANGGQPWNLTRPRAAAEPRLEAWAGAVLGDAASISRRTTRRRARVSAAASRLCALDLIYDAADRRRVRATAAQRTGRRGAHRR